MSQDCDLINGLAVEKLQETRCPVCLFSFSSGTYARYSYPLFCLSTELIRNSD